MGFRNGFISLGRFFWIFGVLKNGLNFRSDVVLSGQHKREKLGKSFTAVHGSAAIPVNGMPMLLSEFHDVTCTRAVRMTFSAARGAIETVTNGGKLV